MLFATVPDKFLLAIPLKLTAASTGLDAMNAGKIDYQFISYADAIHAFTSPSADKLAAANGMQGKIAYNAAADRRSWQHMQDFFAEIFAKKE